MLQHAVLVDARLVCKSVFTDDRLVPRRMHSRNTGYQPRCWIEPRRIDAGLEAEEFRACPDGHDGLFQAAVTGALADAVDRALDLARAGVDGRQAVGDGHAEIVMAVHAQYDSVDSVDVLRQIAEQAIEFGWHGIAHGVGNVNRCRAGFDGGRNHFRQIGQLGAGRIFRRKLHIINQLARHLYRTDRAPDDLFLGHLEFMLTVNRTGGNKHMDSMTVGTLYGIVDLLNISGVATGKSTNNRAEVLIRYGFDRFEIAGRSGREARFDNVHVQFGQRLGNAEFLAERHTTARGLFSVPQCRVENSYPVVSRFV